jgi:hypothetical protein
MYDVLTLGLVASHRNGWVAQAWAVKFSMTMKADEDGTAVWRLRKARRGNHIICL